MFRKRLPLPEHQRTEHKRFNREKTGAIASTSRAESYHHEKLCWNLNSKKFACGFSDCSYYKLSPTLSFPRWGPSERYTPIIVLPPYAHKQRHYHRSQFATRPTTFTACEFFNFPGSLEALLLLSEFLNWAVTRSIRARHSVMERRVDRRIECWEGDSVDGRMSEYVERERERRILPW